MRILNNISPLAILRRCSIFFESLRPAACLPLLICCTASAQVEVEIHGVQGALLDNVRAHLSLLRDEEKTPDIIEQHYLKADKEIQAALRPYGYYHPNIISTRDRDEETQEFDFTIDKGPAVHIEKIDVQLIGEAKTDPKFQHLIKSFKLKTGERLIQPFYDKFKEALLLLANNLGYFQAKFTDAGIYISAQKNTATVVLHLDSGPRYVFGAVNFSESPFTQDLLQRYVPFAPGTPYDSEQLNILQQGLNSNPNFASATLIPKQDHETHTVALQVDLIHRKALKLEGGLGFGTDTGYRVLAAWQSRRINDLGHSIDNRYQFSEFKDILTLSYTIPGHNPLSNHYIFSASHINDRPPKRNANSRSERVSGSYQYHHPASAFSHAITLQYQTEQFRQVNDTQKAELLMPIYTVQWRQTDDDLLINDGLRVNFESKAASSKIVSSTSMLQGKLSARWVKRTSERFRLLTRAQLGATGQNHLRNIPPSLRFYAGGDNSVRGYAFESLSPEKVNDQGEKVLTGGKYLLEGSLELERVIVNKWRGAVFFDMGNAVNGLNDTLKQGAGFGIRFESPIGLVKLDFANAISLDNKPWRIHFSIGPDL